MTLIRNPIDAREQRWLWTIIAVHLALIALPYLWVIGLVPEGRVWGGLLYNTDDQNVHLAWAKQAAQGSFFIRDAFTTENLSDNSQPLFFNSLTWLMGTLSRLGVPIIVLYHAFRLIAAALALWCFHGLCVQLSPNRRVRLGAVALAAFAGSWGWIRDIAPGFVANRILIDRPFVENPVNNIMPPSGMIPEAFGAISAFVFVLNVVSFALLCATYAHLLRAQNGERRALWVACACALLLANIHTYDALPLIVVLAVWFVISQRNAKRFCGTLADKSSRFAPLIVAGAAMVPILYQVIVFSGSEEFRIKALTLTSAPPPLEMLFSYAPLLLPALIGIRLARRDRDTNILLPAIWLGAIVLLIYQPLSFARKMIEGVHLPVCFLASIAFVHCFERLKSPTLRRAAWTATIGIYAISTLQFIGFCIGTNWADNNISRPGSALMPPLHLSKGDAAALRKLNALSAEEKRGRAVLSLPKLGGWIPGATGLNVYVGHWAETLNNKAKFSNALRYFGGSMSDPEALKWLRDNHIGYVVEGEYERGVFKSLPSARLGFRRIFERDGTAIFVVP